MRHCRTLTGFIALALLLVVVPISAFAQDAAGWIDIMRDGSAEARSRGREGVMALGITALPALIAATSDEEAFIRWEAVNALGTLAANDPTGFESAIPAVSQRALTDPDSHTRWRSLWALSMYLAHQEAELIIPRLREGLNAMDEQHRWWAAVALAYFRQPEAPPLLNAGIHRETYFDRWEAIFCMGMIHNDESVVVLTSVIQDIANWEADLRQEAALTLGHMGDSRAIPALTQSLFDPEPHVRWRVASSLERIGGTDVLPDVEAALARETDTIAIENMTQIVERLLYELEKGRG